MKLFAFEITWAEAAFDAVLPEQTALPHGIAKMNPGRFLADTIATCPFEQSLGLRLALWIVALAPLFLLGRARTIATLEPLERQRVLERLLASRVYAVRQLVVAFKAMGSLLYAQSPEARDAMTTPRVTMWESGLVQVRRRKKAAPAPAVVVADSAVIPVQGAGAGAAAAVLLAVGESNENAAE